MPAMLSRPHVRCTISSDDFFIFLSFPFVFCVSVLYFFQNSCLSRQVIAVFFVLTIIPHHGRVLLRTVHLAVHVHVGLRDKAANPTYGIAANTSNRIQPVIHPMPRTSILAWVVLCMGC